MLWRGRGGIERRNVCDGLTSGRSVENVNIGFGMSIRICTEDFRLLANHGLSLRSSSDMLCKPLTHFIQREFVRQDAMRSFSKTMSSNHGKSKSTSSLVLELHHEIFETPIGDTTFISDCTSFKDLPKGQRNTSPGSSLEAAFA